MTRKDYVALAAVIKMEMRPAQLSLEPGDLIGLREERTRKTYYFPIAAAFDFAVKMHVAAARAQKQAGKRK